MKHLSIILFLVSFVFTANAQRSDINTGLGIGFQINQYQRDFGLGVNLTSPYFADDKIAIRLRGNLMFNEHVENNETTWSPYSNISLGLIGVGGYVGDNIKLYGEGGMIGLLPPEEISSDSFKFGGYGLFGFEFYMKSSNNYFIEIGGVGTGAKADKLPNSPIFSNGLIVSAGFRIHIN